MRHVLCDLLFAGLTFLWMTPRVFDMDLSKGKGLLLKPLFEKSGYPTFSF